MLLYLLTYLLTYLKGILTHELECGPMPNVMAALPNIGDALCSTPQVWLTPNTGVPCSNAAKTRNPLKLAGVPQTTGRSQPLVGRTYHIVGTCGGDIAG